MKFLSLNTGGSTVKYCMVEEILGHVAARHARLFGQFSFPGDPYRAMPL